MLQKELEKLNTGNTDFNSHLRELYVKFPNNKEEIADYVENLLKNASSELDEKIDALSVKIQIMENTQLLPLSYIAKNYFHKTKAWLYQRINGNIVNGKTVSLTDSEKVIFNNALKDISKRIGSINIA